MNWTTSARTQFQTLRKYLPQIMPIINKTKIPLNTKGEMTNFLDSNPSHRIHEKYIHNYYENTLKQYTKCAPKR